MHPALTEVAVATSREAEEAVYALLEETTGQAPSVYQEARRNRTTLSVHLVPPHSAREDLEQQLRDGLRRMRQCGLDPAPGRVRIRKLPAVDWAESWKKHFPVLEVGHRLLIRPSWSRRRPRKSQAVVQIDPGLSFGTGHHPTTQFCLEELVRAEPVSSAKCLLDAGTGSALLAIAGARLGYHPIDAFDFDPVAIRVARANARRNGVSRRLRIFRLDLRAPDRRLAPRDVVCANLQADLLLEEADRLTSYVLPGGRLILAGILRREIADVVSTYAKRGFRRARTRSGGEWTSVCLVREGK